VEAPDQNDPQTQAEFRDFVAKQFETLSLDERRELNALIVKLAEREFTISDLQRRFQLFKKAGLLSDEARIQLDKVEGSGGLKSQAEVEALIASHPEVEALIDRLVQGTE
jgi:hypothetical protein